MLRLKRVPETKTVEESIHVKFDDKGSDHDTSESVKNAVDFQVIEKHPEAGSSKVSISVV